MSSKLFWLSDEQWARIEPHLPTDVRGVERVDDRRVISGIVHVLKSGCRWCDCPEAYGPYTTIYNRFVRWAQRGVWENLFRQLAGNGRSADTDRKSTRLNSSHSQISYAVFCLKKKKRLEKHKPIQRANYLTNPPKTH